jgi:hypothetical protein
LSLLIWYCSLLQHFYALLFPEKWNLLLY